MFFTQNLQIPLNYRDGVQYGGLNVNALICMYIRLFLNALMFPCYVNHACVDRYVSAPSLESLFLGR